jgi:hypothetical protein
MRRQLALMALLLPLSGCVVPPDQVGYGYGYPSPGYAGVYPQPGYEYSGSPYYDGSPTMAVEGSNVPLIFYGGSWGYWDRGHSWHHAPDNVSHNLNQRYPGGSGFHPGAPPPGGGFGGRPPSGPPPGGGFVGRPVGGPPPGGGFVGRPAGGPPPGGGFAGRPPGVAPPGAPAPAARPPIAAAVGRPGGPPPSGHQRDEHH